MEYGQRTFCADGVEQSDGESSDDESGEKVVDLSPEKITELIEKMVNDEVSRETRRLVNNTKRWEDLNRHRVDHIAVRDAMLLRELGNSVNMVVNKAKDMAENCVSYKYQSWEFADTAGQLTVSAFNEAYRFPEINLDGVGVQPWETFFGSKLHEATRNIIQTFDTALQTYEAQDV